MVLVGRWATVIVNMRHGSISIIEGVRRIEEAIILLERKIGREKRGKSSHHIYLGIFFIMLKVKSFLYFWKGWQMTFNDIWCFDAHGSSGDWWVVWFHCWLELILMWWSQKNKRRKLFLFFWFLYRKEVTFTPRKLDEREKEGVREYGGCYKSTWLWWWWS